MIISQSIMFWQQIMLWGFVATIVMTTVLHGSQGLGYSRLSMSFLLGTLITGNRSLANVLGFITYMVGGWVFALFYFAIMLELNFFSWWIGAIIGFIHAVFILVVILPLLPFIHPRMATEYDGPDCIRRLEPPGFMGLNYGYRTPLTTITGHIIFGAILGASLGIPH